MQITLTPKTSESSELFLKLPPEIAKTAEEVVIFLVEDSPEVHVLRGENSGVTMSGNFAVRQIRAIPVSAAKQPHTVLLLPAGVNPAKTHVVAIATSDSSKIISAASVAW